MAATKDKITRPRGVAPRPQRLLGHGLVALRGVWPAIALICVMLAAWQAISSAGLVEQYVLPAPWDIAKAMVSDAGLFWTASIPTLTAIIVGFVISILIALPIAIGMVYSPLLQRAIYPLLVLSQVVPKVALAPLFIIWFGFGTAPKVFMVVLIAFFPLVVDAVVGFQAARPESLMLVRSMGASRWQAFWKVRFPWALPSIFAGAKVAITLAVVGAVVAEFVGADNGLGVVITQARGNLDTVTVFAGIGFLSIIGLALFAIVSVLERVLVRGSRSGRSFEAAGSL
ncbi:hypothetical protein ASG73_17270 [Janibacter sp. Soil728]|uniref:ABC transporter permease n=1 Tax=Janibacter sp. Soil728 TaxID=1736393 RepID=UPI0006FF505C|nr:ABC transporter permease [Janibacter sp. Soil728]KRE35090.1 hypothetical protein ASG73_17270 [Janibacter sp. Soil728]